LSVFGSTVGREGCEACVEGRDGAGRVAGSPGAGRVAGWDVDGREGRDGSTGFQPSLSFVSQLPGRPGRGL